MAFGYKLEKINPLFAPTITTVKKRKMEQLQCFILEY